MEHIQPQHAQCYKSYDAITQNQLVKRYCRWLTYTELLMGERRALWWEMNYSILILLLTVCGASHSIALSPYCEPQLCIEGVWDPIQCECQSTKCTLSCSSPKILDPVAYCCVCPNKLCPYPKYQNQGTCNCDCLPQVCPNGKIFNRITSTCEFSGLYWQDPQAMSMSVHKDKVS